MAGVYIGATICICIILFGFCCWNNYQDRIWMAGAGTQLDIVTSHTISMSQPDSSRNVEPTFHLFGCVRGVSLVQCLQSGCCHKEQNSQHQSPMDTDVTSVEVNAAPSLWPSADTMVTGNVTNSEANFAPGALDTITEEVDIGYEANAEAPPSSNQTQVVNVDVTNGQGNVAPSFRDACTVTVMVDVRSDSEVNVFPSSDTQAMSDVDVSQCV